MDYERQRNEPGCTSSCQELLGGASADGDVIDGAFLCTFGKFEEWLGTGPLLPIKSAPFRLGPFTWKIIITPPRGSPYHVGIFCKLANSKAMIAKGLGTMLIQTWFALAVVNRRDIAQSIVQNFKHDFSAAHWFKQCGAQDCIQLQNSKRRYLPKLHTFYQDFMPDGVLHVRVHLNLTLNSVVREAFKDWPWHVPQLHAIPGMDTRPTQTIHIRNLDYPSKVSSIHLEADPLQQIPSAASSFCQQGPYSARFFCQQGPSAVVPSATAAPADDAASPAPDDVHKPLQVDTPVVTTTIRVIEHSASGSIGGEFLCKFDGYANVMQDSAQHGRTVPAMKSAPFHLGPWTWKIFIPGHTVVLDPKVKPKRKQFLGVLLRMSKRRAMIAQGLGSLVAQAQCTLTIINSRGKSSIRGFEHAFGTESHNNTRGNFFFAQFTKLHEQHEDFMPDGALHIRVQLQLAIDSALIASVRAWHMCGQLPLQAESGGLSEVAAGQSSSASQCDKPATDQVEEALESSKCDGDRGLQAYGATRAALDSATTALQQLHSHTGNLHLANSRLIGVMTAVGAACEMIETDVQRTELALAQAQAKLQGREPASAGQVASSFHAAELSPMAPGAASIPCQAASGRYSDASSDQGNASS
eukprot:jgi/Ulvmu1/6918/UM031_0126.1